MKEEEIFFVGATLELPLPVCRNDKKRVIRSLTIIIKRVLSNSVSDFGR